MLSKKAFIESNNKYSEIENPRPIISEPTMVYGTRRENSDKSDYSLRNELKSAITDKELITRLFIIIVIFALLSQAKINKNVFAQ